MKSFKQFFCEVKSEQDTVTFDIPLLIKVLEFAREDAKDDIAIHRMVERLIKIQDKGTLSMDDYKFITQIKENYLPEMDVASVGPTNVTGPQSATDPISATAVSAKKKKKYVTLRRM